MKHFIILPLLMVLAFSGSCSGTVDHETVDDLADLAALIIDDDDDSEEDIDYFANVERNLHFTKNDVDDDDYDDDDYDDDDYDDEDDDFSDDFVYRRS